MRDLGPSGRAKAWREAEVGRMPPRRGATGFSIARLRQYTGALLLALYLPFFLDTCLSV